MPKLMLTFVCFVVLSIYGLASSEITTSNHELLPPVTQDPKTYKHRYLSYYYGETCIHDSDCDRIFACRNETCLCPETFTYNNVQNKCVCAYNAIFNETTNACQCPVKHSYFDEANSRCSCPVTSNQFWPKCKCDSDFVFIAKNLTCLPASKYKEPCENDKQCQKWDSRAECNNNSCRCSKSYVPYYSYGYIKCLTKGKTSTLNKDLYSAAMIALSCFILVIIAFIVMFICNRSYTRRLPRRSGSSEGSVGDINDIFNVTDGLAAMRLVDKPPSYQEVVIRDQAVRGVPPPDYSVNQSRERVASVMAHTAINAQLAQLAVRINLRPQASTPEVENTSFNNPGSSGSNNAPAAYVNSGFVADT